MNSTSFSNESLVHNILDSLSELEANTSEEIKRQRTHARFAFQCNVTVHPGNSRERTAPAVDAVMRDVSENGCQIVSPVPIGVGDVFWMVFDPATAKIEPAFCRCVRCWLVREDAFQAGFRFLSPIELPDTIASQTAIMEV